MKENKRTLTKMIKHANEKRWNESIKPVILEDLRKKDKRTWKCITENEITPFTKKLSSAYIHGVAGSGKTVRAVWLMLELSRTKTINGSIQNKGLFINTVELLQELKSSYSSKTVTEAEIIEKYKNIDILVLDDFGLRSSSEWVYEIFYIIINWRYSHFKTTIYTSNNTLSEIADNLDDDRIIRRIFADCEDAIYELNSRN